MRYLFFWSKNKSFILKIKRVFQMTFHKKTFMEIWKKLQGWPGTLPTQFYIK